MKVFLRSIYIAVAILSGCAFGVHAFNTEVYAPNSVLNEGKWVKISVSESGMHCIPTSTLKSWGFSDPSRVRVYGYGGRMLSDILTESDYIDDLPLTASVVTAKGLVFYAIGPTQIDMSDTGLLYHSVNPYSSYGYYFLTEGDEATPKPATGGTALTSTDDCTTETSWLLVHEQELSSIGNSGRMMVGEDFRTNRTQTFSFDLPQRVEGTQLTLKTSFVAAAISSAATVKHIVNDTELPFTSGDQINKIANDSGIWGAQGISSKSFYQEGDKINVSITLSASGTVKLANLDYIELTYMRTLGGSQEFLCSTAQVASEGAGDAGVHVWDVTDPAGYYELETGETGAWRNERAGVRRYVVWSESDNMPTPQKVADVKNQNLHAINSLPDMVIVAPDIYLSAAEEIAEIHRTYPLDSLTVETVKLDQVLNEFGSGAFDPGALRRFFKMLYDRGEAEGNSLKYALMIGKGTCDNRSLTSVGKSVTSPMPLWVSENSMNESLSYSTDDYFALLSDNDGTRPSREDLDIAVGRIPATTTIEAATAASKIKQYLYSMPSGTWRTRLTILADDENSGQHMEQSELLAENLKNGVSGQRMLVDKIYCDAYVRANSTYPQAREELFNDFADGIGVFAFIGHGSTTALGSKMIIGPLDFTNRFHIRRLPFFYAATCSFLKWDNDQKSKAEEMMFQSDGGFIGCISALRPVYITNNGNLSAAFGTSLGEFDSAGKVPTVGEIYQRTKNRVNNDTNKLRYVLMCDPALRLSMPSASVVIDEINGEPVSEDNPFTAMARQQLTITGRILDIDGSLMSDFNGSVTATLYDAEYSTTSHGYGEGKEVTFEQMGDLLFSTAGVAANGEFTVNVQMPSVIADNYRPATLSVFAVSSDNDGLKQAAGLTNNIYAFGYDETTPDDTDAPIIHTMVLNGDGFQSGDDVNTSPLLMATVSDNSGINLSTAGVGQKMTLTVDESETFNDLSIYFTPDVEPTEGAMSGTIAYPISDLKEGKHTLRLRVWDIDGNFADKTLECNVIDGLAPEVYEVYTDALPARTQANFYVRHNRPDQVLKVKVSVYNLLGQPIWSGESEARSNMGISEPLTWDLTDSAGGRVQRGIYVYRAEVSCDGSETTTKSKKLAVANE